jgi:cell division protein FtsW
VPYHYLKLFLKEHFILYGFYWPTPIKGTVIAGANASRWIQVPFIGVTFQTSTLAAMVLFILLHAIYLRREQFRLL